jgi:hypothetical protein
MLEAVKYVTSLANLKFKIEADCLRVVPINAATNEPIIRDYAVDPKKLAAAGLRPTDNVKDLLIRIGISFPDGATAAMANERKMIVKNTDEQHELIEAWLADPQPPSTVDSATPKLATLPGAADPQSLNKTEEKLKSIVFPRIEFRDASIKEVADFLRRKGAELDTTEADPAKRGVSFLLKGSGVPAIPGLDTVPIANGGGANPFDTRVSLSLRNSPLGEVIKYVTELADLKFTVEPHAVVITPAAPKVLPAK